MTSQAVASLVIYAYSTFASSWGAGPALVKAFEKECSCQVRLVDAGSGGGLISRLKLEGENSEADVVIGLDESLIPRAKKELDWTQKFTPFDFAPYAFIYDERRVQKPPTSLDDLLDERFKGQIALQDPRLSTTGLGFLLWVVKEKGEGAWDYLKKLKPQVKVVSPSWDLAYGLFKKKQALLVFSYWTSPAYHIQEEKIRSYKAADFKSGHYVQTEYVTIPPKAKNAKLAERFVKFLLDSPAQEEIAKKNFMYPSSRVKLPPAYSELGDAKTLGRLSEKELANQLEGWLKKWREIF